MEKKKYKLYLQKKQDRMTESMREQVRQRITVCVSQNKRLRERWGKVRGREHLLCWCFIYRYKSQAVIALKQTLLRPYTWIHLHLNTQTYQHT